MGTMTRNQSGTPVATDAPLDSATLLASLARRFDRHSALTNHRQLYGLLQRGIREGSLPAGLQLPPTRRLAAALSMARNTVVHVYEQLALEGYVWATVGRGTHVASIPVLPVLPAAPGRAEREATLSRRGSSIVRNARASPVQWGAFMPGVPEVRLFPTRLWTRLAARCWRDARAAQLSYSTGAGEPALLEALADHLRTTRGVACTPGQIIVTGGSHQSMHLIALLLADRGDRLWLEDPGYWGARSVFQAHGLELVPIEVDAEGLAPTTAQMRRPPRLIFVSPSHQYPTGVLMSHGRRSQLLDYAARHGCWIVEDDYDSEFRYRSQPLPALQGLDGAGRVIYLGTFSKTLFPSMRLAYLVLPPGLVTPFTRALQELYRGGQSLQQATLAAFLAEGHLANCVRRLRSVYGARHDALVAAIRRHGGADVTVHGEDAGLHLVLGLPAQTDDAALARQMAARGVVTRPLSMYALRQPAARRGLVLGYGCVAEAEIEDAFLTVADVLRESREGPAGRR